MPDKSPRQGRESGVVTSDDQLKVFLAGLVKAALESERRLSPKELPEVAASRQLVAGLRSALLRVKEPLDGYVTATWSRRKITNLKWPIRSQKELEGLWIHLRQADGSEETKEIKSTGIGEFRNLIGGEPVVRIELRETQSGPAIAVGGPIPVS